MSETSEVSGLMTSQVLHNTTSSLGSGGGASPCDSQGGRKNDQSGPVPALASLSAALGSGLAWPIPDTCGLPGSASSRSAALQSSLASRLRALTASLGSTLFKLTWKERATPSGRLICALRASAHRTCGSDCGSWPTPQMFDAMNRQTPETWFARNLKSLTKAGNTKPTDLAVLVQMSWPTPHQNCMKGAGHRGRGGLNIQTAALVFLGETATGSHVPTVNQGQLNPAFTRWLMGFPPEWDDCAPTATPSSRKSRRK